MRHRWAGICFAVMALLAGGCSDLVDQDQVHHQLDTTVMLEPGHTVGQAFVARHAGLNGIEVHLSPIGSAEGTVVLHLRESPIETNDVLTTRVSIGPESREGFFRFSFPPLSDSHTGYYYAVLEYTGTEQIEVLTGSLDAYLDGTLYYDDQPQRSQTVFRLSYDRLLIALDLFLLALKWVGYGFAVVGLLFFAGYPLVRGWARRGGLDFTSSLILGAVGVLALWMVFLIWADVMGLRLNATRVRAIAGTSALLGLVGFLRDRDRWWKGTYWTGESPLTTLALWSIIALSIGLRLFVGRGMVMLPGSDTYHHTLISQLFIEQGGIPQSYEPYASLISFSYHWGFHSVVALFRWLFGSEMLVTTKVVALVMNGAVAATVSLLTERVAGDRRAGTIAGALVGLIAVSPFCLLQWGRFTQTAGLLLLPLCLLALLVKKQDSGHLFPVLTITALLVCHYRVTFFLGLFGMIATATAILQHHRNRIKDWFVVGVISIALASPWLLSVSLVYQDPYGLKLSQPTLGGYYDIERLGEPVLSFITNTPLMTAVVPLTAVACFRGKHKATGVTLAGWCFALVAGAVLSPKVLRTNFWDLKSALLSLSVPLGVLSGLGTEALWSLQRKAKHLLIQGGTVILVVTGIAVGLLHLPQLIYGGLFYLRPGDLVAMEWIERNTRKDALFLGKSIQFEWSPGWVVGADAAYWIPLLASRATTMPPMIYPLEWSASQEPIAGLVSPRRVVSAYKGKTALSDIFLKQHGITHTFAHMQDGLAAQQRLSQEPRLKPVYRQDRIAIFQAVR